MLIRYVNVRLCFRLLLWHPDVCSKQVMEGMYQIDLFVIPTVPTYLPTYVLCFIFRGTENASFARRPVPGLLSLRAGGQNVQDGHEVVLSLSISLSLSLSPQHCLFCFLRCPCKPPPVKKASVDWLELGKVAAIVVSLAMSLVSAVFFGRKAFLYIRRRPEIGTVTFIPSPFATLHNC